MHAVMRTVLFIVAVLFNVIVGPGLTAEANAQSRLERRALDGIELFVSPAEGMVFMSRRGQLLAIGALKPGEPRHRGARYQPYGGGYAEYEECVPGYGCRIVGGYGDPYYAPGYAQGYGGGYGLPEIVLSGRDLALKPVSHANLPLSSAGPSQDVAMDHWRILYERTGRLASNPAPLVSTGALLAPLYTVDPVTTAGIDTEGSGEPAGPVEIAIGRRNARDVTADIQKLLNKMGHDAGRPDGLAGDNTRAGIRRFQAANGIEITGRLTTSLIDAIYLAADTKMPSAGTLTVRRRGKTLLESSLDIDDAQQAVGDLAGKDETAAPDNSLGTHLFTLTEKPASWQLVTLSKPNAEFAGDVFGFAEKQSHEKAAASALSRIHVPAEIRAKLVALAVPGSTLALSDQRLPDRTRTRY